MVGEDCKGGKNVIQQFNIGSVGQMNTGVETVNNYYGTDGKPIEKNNEAEQPKEKSPMEQREKMPLRKQIMMFVSCLHAQKFVATEWISRYMDLWDKILDLPEVAELVYNPGKQQGATYNRNLVANIIYYLGNQTQKERQVYINYNATQYVIKLGLGAKHPVRGALGNLPPVEIKRSLDRFMDNYLL